MTRSGERAEMEKGRIGAEWVEIPKSRPGKKDVSPVVC